MTIPRFYFQQPSAADKLVAGAEKLTISLLRINGRTCAEYKMEGCVGDVFDDEEDENPPDVKGFVRDVLTQFEKGGA